jgi:short-subunit dehydrogenase
MAVRGDRVRLDGKVVLVTGASSGIGEAVADRLAGQGARVLVHGRDPVRVRRVADRLSATALTVDLRGQGAVAELADQALAAHGSVDAIIHSAGVGWSGRLDQMPPDTLRTLLRVDLEAPVELTRLLLPEMLRRGTGHLCFVSSIAARTGVAGEAVYAAAKAGLDGFAESLRYEVSRAGVEVSVVVPGAVDTPFFERRGRAYGRRRPRQQPADVVAAAVVRCLEEGRPEAVVPTWLRVAGVVRVVSPAGFRRLSDRFGEQVPPRPGGGSGDSRDPG